MTLDEDIKVIEQQLLETERELRLAQSDEERRELEREIEAMETDLCRLRKQKETA